ncbi:hypothetical protein C6P45_000858 [Maudiozyma exigua]|uniref:DNA replication factor Cdt1 C-terminal domain-containing protein n=1 Tax=Maudiozyma exigua TaxID=34358 RepID=A0A9P6W602_MAUEX|nr:hypothetical protein C6P45_000858 [Kazachstania exigua]
MSRVKREYVVPAIDLNKISNEEQLLPVIKAILLNHDTFLLKNYANKESLDSLLNDLQYCPPPFDQGFDANFTGTLPLDDNNSNIYLEQYIFNPGDALQFDRDYDNVCLSRIQSRLSKVAHYFGLLCVKAFNHNDLNLSQLTEDNAFKLTRFYQAINERHTVSETNPLADILGISVNYNPEEQLQQEISESETIGGQYTQHSCAGLLSVYPSTVGIRYKPASVAADDNRWVPIQDDPTALVVHTGQLLAELTQGMFASSPLQIDIAANVVEVTMYPNLVVPLGQLSNNYRNDVTMATVLLEQQIKELPQVAKKFYNRQWSKQQLQERIIFYKKLFTTSETVLSLYAMSRGSTVAPKLDNLLPQMTNLMKRKITQQDFLRMISIWPQVYVLGSDSNHEITVQLPKRDVLASLTNHSRKLDFSEFAEKWFLQHSELNIIPLDVPMFKINKRRGSDNFESHGDWLKKDNHNDGIQQPLTRNYLSNNKDSYVTLSQDNSRNNSQSDLLQRLQEKERRSATLLQERQQKYQQFLTIKMKQVFNIIFSLQWNQPYTITHLKDVIVDSLQDSNNPIGPEEAEEVLMKLQSLQSDKISVKEVDGGLKVLRWKDLNRDQFEMALANFST